MVYHVLRATLKKGLGNDCLARLELVILSQSSYCAYAAMAWSSPYFPTCRFVSGSLKVLPRSLGKIWLKFTWLTPQSRSVHLLWCSLWRSHRGMLFANIRLLLLERKRHNIAS